MYMFVMVKTFFLVATVHVFYTSIESGFNSTIVFPSVQLLGSTRYNVYVNRFLS